MTCSCGKPVHSRGFCSTCYCRGRRLGTLELMPNRTRRQGRPIILCTNGCDKPAVGQGLCDTCYKRGRRHGTLQVLKVKNRFSPQGALLDWPGGPGPLEYERRTKLGIGVKTTWG